MKKVFFAILMMTASFSASSQIKVSTTQKEVLFKSSMSQHSLTKFTDDSVSLYAFYFRDMQYQQIIEYKYFSLADTSEIKEFFGLVTDVITNGTELNLTLGKENVSVRRFNKNAVTIYIKGGYFYFSRKQIDELLASLK
jgi:hypothetical protein